MGKKKSFHISLQLKYTLSYFAILAVVLILLNSYPLLASQDLLFRSKQDALHGQTAVMASALMELEQLTPEKVEQVIAMLDNSDITRVIVTDPAALIIYDSARSIEDNQTHTRQFALFQSIVTALRGYDITHCRYQDGKFFTTAAAPVTYRGSVIGSIYLYMIDDVQGQLLQTLQQNLRTISIIIGAIAIFMGVLFSNLLTNRITTLLRAIRVVGQGEYDHRLTVKGNDELTHLANEFNILTNRLQETEEVRRRFVSDASHELKTPLASIRLLSDSILQNDTMDPLLVKDFVQDIGEETTRLTRITEHLLALTKLDSTPIQDHVYTEISPVLTRVLKSLTPLAQAHEISIVCSDIPICTPRCTQDDLHQILYNLIENAIKYNAPHGQVEIGVQLATPEVIICVSDTGIGIPDEDKPKIFDRFYRVDKARSRAAGGTGLGLSIVRDTVQRHGGWVSVTENRPQGSTFTVGFPLADEKAGDAL